MSGKIIIIQPNGETTEQSWIKRGPPDFRTIQAAVGGTFAMCKVHYKGKARTAYANDDGLALQLPVNNTATQMARQYGYDVLVGPVAVWVPDPPKAKVGPR